MYGDVIYLLYEIVYTDRYNFSTRKDIVRYVTYSKSLAKRWAAREDYRFVKIMRISKSNRICTGAAAHAHQLKLTKEQKNKYIGSSFEDFLKEENNGESL